MRGRLRQWHLRQSQQPEPRQVRPAHAHREASCRGAGQFVRLASFCAAGEGVVNWKKFDILEVKNCSFVCRLNRLSGLSALNQ